MSEFSGKVVIVTGGGSGIGRGTCLLFVRDGAKVVVVDRNEAAGNETAEMILREGGEALVLNADVSKSSDVERAVEAVLERYGRIDVLVANAAIQLTKAAADTTEKEWDNIHAVNLKGVFLCTKFVVPVMKKQKSGSIVITSSGHATVTYPNCSAYAATKGGLSAFMRGVALDYAGDGIRVNCVVPGTTDTPLLRKYFRDCPDPEAEEKRLLSRIPMRHFVRPEDVGKAIRFLASSEASIITGTSLVVDGGQLAQA